MIQASQLIAFETLFTLIEKPGDGSALVALLKNLPDGFAKLGDGNRWGYFFSPAAAR